MNDIQCAYFYVPDDIKNVTHEERRKLTMELESKENEGFTKKL